MHHLQIDFVIKLALNADRASTSPWVPTPAVLVCGLNSWVAMLQAAQAAVRQSHPHVISALQILQRRLGLPAGNQQEHHKPFSQQQGQIPPGLSNFTNPVQATSPNTFRSSSNVASGQAEAAASQAPGGVGNARREAETPLLHALRNRIMVRGS